MSNRTRAYLRQHGIDTTGLTDVGLAVNVLATFEDRLQSGEFAKSFHLRFADACYEQNDALLDGMVDAVIAIDGADDRATVAALAAGLVALDNKEDAT